MTTIVAMKELECPETPLFLIQCTLKTGDVYRWSTHNATVNGNLYEARVLQHNLFEMRSSSDDSSDGLSRVSVTLANADGYLSPIERAIGWKGAQVMILFVFYDLANNVPASETRVVFQGISNAPDQSTETGLRLTFTNRLNLQRIYLPETQIQKLCPWTFPWDSAQRQEALAGTEFGKYSPVYRCGYSADLSGGAGNLNGSAPYTSCDCNRASCISRGMFSQDVSKNVTSRFGGLEFVPPSIVVRTYKEQGSHVSNPVDNQAAYNDPVPLIYGTSWYNPPIVFARNDGNLTRMEVLLGEGEISSVVKVIANNIEIPVGVSGANMTSTGWYSVVTYGTRNGSFDLNFTDAQGDPLGDPYGSMAMMSVVVPNAISSGQSLPEIQVLIQGLKLPQFDTTGAALGESFTNNPAWVLLDVLRRTGWTLGEIDLVSFANAAAVCNQPVQTIDLNGNSTQIPLFQCNLILTQTRSAADVIRGIRNGSMLFLNFDSQGLLRLSVEGTIAAQQPALPAGSNSTAPLNGGWPVYEFSDGAQSGIALQSNGQSSLRVSSKSTADTPNCYSVEFQDEFNTYQQDSYSITDVEDRALMGQDVSLALPALGIPNFDQATRVSYLFLSKSVDGNTYVDFNTSVKSVNLAPGDIIAVTYAREGFSRQPFRVTRIAPGMNYRLVAITAQLHDDAWYSAAGAASQGTASSVSAAIGVPRPLVGTVLNPDGSTDFGIDESVTVDTDGSSSIELGVSFVLPQSLTSTVVSVALVSLEPLYASTGGSLNGGATFYYAISAVDSAGLEGPLSFTVCAGIPEGSNSNCVTLQNISLSSSAKAFNVYRGATPSDFLRIASNVAPAATFTDNGMASSALGPPDANFDHANFYWRFVSRPQQKADVHAANTIGVTSAGMQVNEFRGSIAVISAGMGAGQERTIISNTESTLTVAPTWDIVPDDTSEFLIADATWQYGATGTSSPATFAVPNQDGALIQISGRAANVHDDECAYALSPLTTWSISGDAGSALDMDVPGQPTFGLYVIGHGYVEVDAIGFANLANTRGVTAATLSLLYLDELAAPSAIALQSAIDNNVTSLTLSAASTAQPGDVVQIGSELLVVQQVSADGLTVQVERGQYGTNLAAYMANTQICVLTRKTFVMPFPLDFFGTESSGSYSYRVVLPDVRISGADLFVTNSKGNSSVYQQAYTSTTDAGLRTLSGGQVSIEVDGPLAIQTGAVPVLVMGNAYSVRDVFANVGTAPTDSTATVNVTRNGQLYCSLSIPAQAATSNVVNGLTLPALQAGDQIGLDIVAVPQDANSVPGADLTVTIRL